MYNLQNMSLTNWIILLTSILTLIPKNKTQLCNETSIISCKYDHENKKCICQDLDCVSHEQMCFHVQSLEITGGLYTYIPSQAFAEYYNLKHLTISYSDLQEIHGLAFDGLNKLETLHLKSNKLEKIFSGAFSGLSNLTLLNLENNKIRNLPSGIFHNLTRLSSLFLSQNLLNDSDMQYFDKPLALTLLYMDKLGINSLQQGCFQNLPDLEILSLKDNLLEAIHMGTFDGLISLSSLDLNRNKIKTVQEGSFRSTKNLKYLSLNMNNIWNFKQLLNTLPKSLESLAIFGNNITQLHGFQTGQLKNLTNLGLSINHVKTLHKSSFLGLQSLENVDLSQNNLETVDLTFFPHSIKNIKLSGNTIENLVIPTTMMQLPQLENLILISNNFQTFPVSFLELTPKLTKLDLKLNNLLCDCQLKDLANIAGANYSISAYCSQSVEPFPVRLPSGEVSSLSENCMEPVVLTISDHLDVLQGSSITLNCSVKGIPHPSVNWIGPTGQEQPGKYDYANQITFFDIEEVGKSHNGTYICSVKNSEGSSNGSINVFVIPLEEKEFTTSYTTIVTSFETQEPVSKTFTELESNVTTMDTYLTAGITSKSLTTSETLITDNGNTNTLSTTTLTFDFQGTTEVKQTEYYTTMTSDQTTEGLPSTDLETSSKLSIVDITGETPTYGSSLTPNILPTTMDNQHFTAKDNLKQTSTSVDIASSTSDILTTIRKSRLTQQKLLTSKPNTKQTLGFSPPIRTTIRNSEVTTQEKQTIVSNSLQTSMTSSKDRKQDNRMTTTEKVVDTTPQINVHKRSSGEIVAMSFLFIISITTILILLKCLIKKLRVKYRKPINVFLLDDVNEELWKDEEISTDGNVCETQIHVGLLSNFKDFNYG